MKRLLAALLLVLLFPILAHSKTCEDDSIEEVADDGAVLIMLSGSSYQVADIDRIDSALWLPSEKVLICAETVSIKGQPYSFYTILNEDDHGEKVSALRIGSRFLFLEPSGIRAAHVQHQAGRASRDARLLRPMVPRVIHSPSIFGPGYSGGDEGDD